MTRAPIWILLTLLAAGCRQPGETVTGNAVELEEIARSDRRWTGIAVSKEGRIFVNFPRWSDDVPVSVAELYAGSRANPYPDRYWNNWDKGVSPGEHFVCVQALYVDDEDFLWILDPANPKFEGVVAGGPKLVKVDLSTNSVVDVVAFDLHAAPEGSYLNDVRVDTKTKTAYLTDSGLGALVVVDLESKRARRLLAEHPSTKAEEIVLRIGGLEWRAQGGSTPQVHADGIALSPDRRHIFWQALTGRTLYWIATRDLLDQSLDAEQLGARVQRAAESGASDGLLYAPDGYLYFASIEAGAIRRLKMGGGGFEVVAKDPRISWPDSFALGPDGSIYFTTARIHEGDRPRGPFRVFRFRP